MDTRIVPNGALKKICNNFLWTVLLTTFTTATVFANGYGKKQPLVLDEQGSFYAGGEIVTIPSRVASGTPQPGQISINHVYVQYQIPTKLKYRYPIIMVHGGGHTGKTYETTPDGREGWFTSFTRRGFAPYVMDDPNRGRACCDPTRLHLARLGLIAPEDMPNMNIYTKERSYEVFRFGPAFPEAYPNSRFPLEAIDQYAPQWVLTYRDQEENDKITNGIIALIDEIGPVILMTHSQSGPRGLLATLARPDLVKAYISVEPAGFALPDAQAVETVAGVPMLTIFGDNVDLSGFATNWLNSATETLGAINAEGGDGTVIELPNIGIYGNSHMMMMDNNNEHIANIIENWIKHHVPHVRGRGRHHHKWGHNYHHKHRSHH